MRHKFLKTLMLSSVLTLGAIPMTSCSMFFGESGFTIKDVTTNYNEQTGDTIITMTFSDDEVKPLTFVVPRGIAGVDGVSIENVLTDVVSEEGRDFIKVTITYSDKKVPNTELKLPISKDGKGIFKVNVDVDVETNDTILVFEYTDGTKSDEIRIPQGIKGEDGVGILELIINPIDPTTNTIEVEIVYTDPYKDNDHIFIPCGVGIKSITFDESKTTKTEYALKVVYSDDSETNPHIEYIMLPIPQSTKWLSGLGVPTDDLGGDGDFFIDKKSGDAYQKNNGKWEFFFCMRGTGSAIRYTVMFDANGGKFTELPTSSSLAFRISYGEYIELSEFPEVTYEGHKFEGWYTSKEANPNGGHFTDLTPVLKDMTLYARWSINK